jgi:large subunit ribosomal protein L3
MNSNPGIIGKKLGMTQFFAEDGNIVRCTVIESDLTVLGKRTKAKDGYDALIVGLGERNAKHTGKPVAGQYQVEKGLHGVKFTKQALEALEQKANETREKAKEAKAKDAKSDETKAAVAEADAAQAAVDEAKKERRASRVVRELRMTAAEVAKYQIGSRVDLQQVFEPGQFVDVQGITRGRGFTGVMRRWNFSGSVRTHGSHEYKRHGGSIGTNMTPGRTLPGLKMPGQYGNETISVLNLKVGRIVADKSLLLVVGAVPGARNSIVTVRLAVKKRPDAHKVVNSNGKGKGKGKEKAE